MKTFEEQHQHFGQDLWREIFSQVIYPVFEDIRLQVELACRKGNQAQAQSHIVTLQSLLVKINSFLGENLETLPSGLLSCYIDILLLFASNLNNQELAFVVME